MGHYGGSYKVTYDLYKKYGEMRLLDTPICGEFHRYRLAHDPHANSGALWSMLVVGAHAPRADGTMVAAAENGFMGMGIGAAMTGLRPIVEGMNMGFLLLAYNQISNNAGMLHYTSGGQYKVRRRCSLPPS